MYVICWQDYDCTELLGYTNEPSKANQIVSDMNMNLTGREKSNTSMFYFYEKLEEME